MKAKRKIVLGLTGIRSEYYLQKSVFHAIQNHPALRLELIVTGAHLSPLHGITVEEISRDGFPIAEKIESLLWSDRDAGRLKGAAAQLQVLAHVVDRLRPDWILAPADREEALTAAACGAYMNIPVAHLCAGDRVVGNVDDVVRHAVSRLSHLLLTTHEEARRRLIRSGEQAFRVHNVGHPGLDRFASTEKIEWPALARAVGLEGAEPPYLVVLQHPISSEIAAAPAQMEETLKAIKRLCLPTVVIHPNSDAGSRAMVEVIERYRGRIGSLAVTPSLPDALFVNLLRGAFALIGNSSLGFFEAPYLHLPVVHLGNRQKNRRHSGNVAFLPHRAEAIATLIARWRDRPAERARLARCGNPFGNGRTGKAVARLLARTDATPAFLKKDITY